MANVMPSIVTADIARARRNGIKTAVFKREAHRATRRRLRIVTRELLDDPDAAHHGRRADRAYTGWDLD